MNKKNCYFPIRPRRSSSSSTAAEASLFPIYESPDGLANFTLPSDLDSTAGSEWEGESSNAQLAAVSKEQLFNMVQKMRTR